VRRRLGDGAESDAPRAAPRAGLAGSKGPPRHTGPRRWPPPSHRSVHGSLGCDWLVQSTSYAPESGQGRHTTCSQRPSGASPPRGTARPTPPGFFRVVDTEPPAHRKRLRPRSRKAARAGAGRSRKPAPRTASAERAARSRIPCAPAPEIRRSPERQHDSEASVSEHGFRPGAQNRSHRARMVPAPTAAAPAAAPPVRASGRVGLASAVRHGRDNPRSPAPSKRLLRESLAKAPEEQDEGPTCHGPVAGRGGPAVQAAHPRARWPGGSSFGSGTAGSGQRARALASDARRKVTRPEPEERSRSRLAGPGPTWSETAPLGSNRRSVPSASAPMTQRRVATETRVGHPGRVHKPMGASGVSLAETSARRNGLASGAKP
jgi:hypothetical protein